MTIREDIKNAILPHLATYPNTKARRLKNLLTR